MTAAASTAPRNADVDWAAFDPAAYAEHNYALMRADDAQILGIARDWFRQAVPAGARLRGIDVGTGSNLYPALALALHCKQVTLYEHSAANVAWLRRELTDPAESWEPFWNLAGEGRDLIPWEFAKHEFGRTTVIQQGSIFDLPRREWEIGTMAFVAESLTGDRGEFEDAVGCFLGALRPGAPFAAAFMENSCGYQVGDTWFPAVAVDHANVEALLRSLGACDLEVQHADIDPAPIRAGYSGYVTAVGRTGRA